MAYKNVKNVTLSTDKPLTLYQHVRDFLKASGLYDATTGVGGWTSLYAYESVPGSVSYNDWCYLKTTGENGEHDFRIFIKVTTLGLICYSGTYIQNTSTATPSFRVTCGQTSEIIATPANWTAFYIYADKNFVAIVVRAGTTNYIHRFGILDCVAPGYHTPQAITAGISAGSNISFTVGDSNHPDWAVGNRIQLLSWENPGYVESSTITANDTGTDTVTVGNNSYAHPAGALAMTLFPYVCDYYVSKSLSHSMSLLVNHTDGTGGNYVNSPFYVSLLFDTVATSQHSGKFHGAKVVVGVAGTGGVFFTFPSWVLLTKKRSVEEELHTDGTDDWRYFSFYNDTSTSGYLYKEV